MNGNQYLEEIKKKLDLMNRQSGIDPQKNKKSINDPDAIDIFSALGSSALIYMAEQK